MRSHRFFYAPILLLGAWLCLSPFVLYYPPAALANARLSGLALMLFAGLATIESHDWERWANLALGGWLIVSPFVLDFDDNGGATGNAIFVGFVVGLTMLLAIAPPSFRATPRHTRTECRGLIRSELNVRKLP